MAALYLALIVPLILTTIFYFIKKHEFTWWEFFIPIGSVLIAIFISKIIIETSTTRFTEYWGSTVVSVYEQEPYNYWVSKTCSREVACGTDSDGNTIYCTEYYDCSYQEDVSPKWWAITDINQNISINERLYEELVQQFNARPQTIKTHRNHSSRSRAVGSRGTKFEGKAVGRESYTFQANWDRREETRKPYTSKESYVNKIKASDLTIFNIDVVSQQEADSLGLFEYPDFINGFEYPTILGIDVSKDMHDNFRKLNAKYGVSNQLRLWVLVFKDKPLSHAIKQENYWVKGNKNELVLCIGLGDDNRIEWSHTFSWALSTSLTAEIKYDVMELYMYRDTVQEIKLPPMLGMIDDVIQNAIGDRTNIVKDPPYPVLNNTTLNELHRYLYDNLHRFERRSFEEFSYLKVMPSKKAIIIVYIIAFIVSLLTNLWVINNDVNDDAMKLNRRIKANQSKYNKFKRF